jgi:hypothetical protein
MMIHPSSSSSSSSLSTSYYGRSHHPLVVLVIFCTFAAVLSIVLVEVEGFSYERNQQQYHHWCHTATRSTQPPPPTTTVAAITTTSKSFLSTSRGINSRCFPSSSSSLSSSALRSTTSDSSTASKTGGGGGNQQQQQPPPPTFDAQYYQPIAEQFTRNDSSPARITLTRFLSQYVKDHPEVRTVKDVFMLCVNCFVVVVVVPTAFGGLERRHRGWIISNVSLTRSLSLFPFPCAIESSVIYKTFCWQFKWHVRQYRTL